MTEEQLLVFKIKTRFEKINKTRHPPKVDLARNFKNFKNSWKNDAIGWKDVGFSWKEVWFWGKDVGFSWKEIGFGR